MSEPIINIGASKEAVQAANDAIHSVLYAERSDQVTIVALETLSSICKVGDTTIRDCQFTNNKE